MDQYNPTSQDMDQYEEMENAAMEAARKSEGQWDPIRCPRSDGNRCGLCERVGIRWDEPYWTKARAGMFKKENGDPVDYQELKGIVWQKSQESGNAHGPTKEYKQWARLWAATQNFYSLILVVPNWNQLQVVEYGKEIWEPLYNAEVQESDYQGFWHPATGTNVQVTKFYDGRTKYRTDFRRDASEVPNAKAILTAAFQFPMTRVVDMRDKKELEFYRFSKLKDNVPGEFRWIPWNSKNPALFFRRAWWHRVPNENRLVEAGVTTDQVSKDLIIAAINGQYDPFGGNIYTTGQGGGITQVPQNAPVPDRSPMPQGSGPLPVLPGQPQSTEVPLLESVVIIPGQPQLGSVPETVPSPAQTPVPVQNEQGIADLLKNQDVPIDPQGPPGGGEFVPATPPAQPATGPETLECYGKMFNPTDENCIGGQNITTCPYAADCQNLCGK